MSNFLNNTLKVGMVLNNKWGILEFIGKGAMGEVYRAHQLNLNRDVAIKVISQDRVQGLDGDEEDIETAFHRFRREVQTMAKTRHSNVLQIFDYGSTSVKKAGKDVPVEYIAMEYIPGNTLRSTMSEDGFKEAGGKLGEERLARPIRIEYPGAWYHVTCRENERKEIFSDDLGRVKFADILAKSAALYGIEVHAYVLMDNHFHLVIMSQQPNLKSFM